MKKLTLLFVLIIAVQYSGVCQDIQKYRANGLSMNIQDENGSWSGWSEWVETDRLIVTNSRLNRIIVYANTKDVYDIIKSEEVPKKNGVHEYHMYCVDNKGYECLVKICLSKENGIQFYIAREEYILLFNVTLLD